MHLVSLEFVGFALALCVISQVYEAYGIDITYEDALVRAEQVLLQYPLVDG